MKMGVSRSFIKCLCGGGYKKQSCTRRLILLLTHHSDAVMLRRARGLQLLAILLLLLLSGSSSTVHNDATESLSAQPVHDTQEEPAIEDMNQARNGGRRQPDAARAGVDQSQMGCRELRSTKYISDGQCTSVNPIKELVCAGECLPAHLLPNWIGRGSNGGKYWSRHPDSPEWRCVIDRTRTQRIRLQCQDGSSRTYKITVVTSCKCKRYTRQQNDSGHKDTTVNSGRQRKHPKKAELPEEVAQRQSDS